MRFGPVIAPMLLLAACSGGGGGGAPAPTPAPTANRAPSFTSAAAASVAENVLNAYQATATDPDGNALTFTIAGGADAARFAITAAGALSFAAAPNFERPADADANNVYAVQLRVSDGSLAATLDLQVTVTDSREGIAVRRVATGFNQPVFVAAIPGSGDVFVVEKTGNIYRFNPAAGTRSLALTVGDLSTSGERGLLGLALYPDFATSNRAVVYATNAAGTIELRAYTLGVAGYTVGLSIPHPGADNHNGGWIAFGPDGHLYAAVGDGGGAGDPGNNAQNVNSRLGKILRLAVSTAAGGPPFAPAPGNPYVGGGGDPWIFALGLRNPFRASFQGDRLIIGDVGQSAREEIDVVRTGEPGLNFGWRFLEGTQAYSGTAPAGLTAPVSEYPRSFGGTIIGGYVYRGPIASLVGSYVFGDFVSGNLWTLPASSLVQGSLYPATSYERRNADFTPDTGAINQLVSFGEDDAGNLFIVDLDGEIFMLVPA